MSKIKLAYLVSHPIQYQAPLLRKIAQHPDIDLTVLFQSDFSLKKHKDTGFGESIEWDVPLVDGYSHEFLPSVGSNNVFSFLRPLNYGLLSRLRVGKFDALWVHGYSHYSYVQAVLASKILGIKVLMRGESNLISKPRGALKLWLKDKILRSLFARCDAFLCIGSLNREYYRHYGVQDKKLFSMPYAVDNTFFQEKAAGSASTVAELRESLGLESGRPVILYASKLMARKHPMALLEAYLQLSEEDKKAPNPYLLFIGSGEERAALEEKAKSTGWDSIRFLGFQNQTQLPAYFALCDVFVLASSYEPWGLVVNEAMNAAKPVIVSDQVGCAPDLVEQGTNGFVVPPRDVLALTKALKATLDGNSRSYDMGQNSLRKIKEWGFRQDVEGLRASLRYCLGR